MPFGLDDPSNDHEYQRLHELYSGMPHELQVCMCLASDFDTIRSEYGGGEPQTKLARELYAAAILVAAQAGVKAPPLDALPYCLHTLPWCEARC